METTTKIFITAQMFSIILFALFFGKKSASETTTRYSDDGWTRYYTYSKEGYKIANRYGFTGIIISVAGWLYFIWTF